MFGFVFEFFKSDDSSSTFSDSLTTSQDIHTSDSGFTWHNDFGSSSDFNSHDIQPMSPFNSSDI